MIHTGYWTFKQKYGCEIEFIETTWATMSQDLANFVLSGDPPDFTKCWESDFPYPFINDLCAPVGDYIDYDDPLWSGMKYFSDHYFSLNGEPLLFLTDVQNNSLVLYNRRVFTEWGFDDPAELFYNDEWTWDKMLDMAMEFSDVDEGRYAFNGWHTDATFFSSTGTFPVLLDSDTGTFYSNIDDPRLERAAQFLMDVSKNDLGFPHWSNGWSLNYGDEGGGMKEGVTLFAMGPCYILDEIVSKEQEEARFGDMDAGEVMVVPAPRDPNGDGEYYIDSMPVGYSLIKGAKNPEGVTLLAACDRFKVIDPTVIRIDERQKRDVLGWTQEMLDMWNEMYNIAGSHNTIVQYSGLENVTTYYNNMISFNSYDNQSSWAELKEANKDALEYAIEELNELIKNYSP